MPRIMDLPAWSNEQQCMPRIALPNVPVATEEELLAFANALRKAGGAAALPALLPSTPVNSSYCLIATSLNFDCAIDGNGNWTMSVEGHEFTEDQIKAISTLMGSEPLDWSDFYIEWELPEHIGNAADAFDRGVAFQNYRQDT